MLFSHPVVNCQGILVSNSNQDGSISSDFIALFLQNLRWYLYYFRPILWRVMKVRNTLLTLTFNPLIWIHK